MLKNKSEITVWGLKKPSPPNEIVIDLFCGILPRNAPQEAITRHQQALLDRLFILIEDQLTPELRQEYIQEWDKDLEARPNKRDFKIGINITATDNGSKPIRPQAFVDFNHTFSQHIQFGYNQFVNRVKRS